MRLFLSLERLTTGAALIAAIGFLLLATALAMYQVTMRFVFDNPSTWSEAMSRSAMIWSVFLGAAAAFRHGSMIAVEVIQNVLPIRLGLALYQLANILSLIFFAVLFWQGWSMTQRVARQTLAGLDISIAWVYVALPTGAVFAMLAILGCMIRAWRGEWHRTTRAAEGWE